jgi:hypothetical protein
LSPDLLREAGELEHVGVGLVEMVDHGRELAGEGVQHPVGLGVHRLGVGLVIDRVQQCLHPPRLPPSGTEGAVGDHQRYVVWLAEIDEAAGFAVVFGQEAFGRWT